MIELAGEAANGVRGHVGLSTDAPFPRIQDVSGRFKAVQLHSGPQRPSKAIISVYMVKAVTEKMGKVDSEELAKRLTGMTIKPAEEPGILMETT